MKLCISLVLGSLLLCVGGCITTSKGAGWNRIEWGTTGYVGVANHNDGDKNASVSSLELDVDPLVDNIINLRPAPPQPRDSTQPTGAVDPAGGVK